MDTQAYPVHFSVERPERFERPHVFLRLLILILVSAVVAFAWVLALIYIALPVVSAAFASRDKDRFHEEGAVQIRRVLHWIVAFDAYLSLLTDRLPTEDPPGGARFDVRFTGSPTTGSALMRLITSIPNALVLAALGFAATITGIVAAVFVLVQEDYPDGLYCFHTGVVRWFARLLAYHGSLVDEYPPYDLDTSTEVSPPLAPGPTA
jgi:hypothetical protein